MANEADVKKLQTGIKDLQQAFALASAARQNLVISTIVLREGGYTQNRVAVSEFERARGAILRAAADLDNVLNALRSSDSAAWNKMTVAINQGLAKAGGRISSTSIAEMIDVALPPFPVALLVPADTPAARAAVAAERANYDMSKPLGALPAIPLLTSGCAAAAAATSPTGIGPVVVGVGCALAGLAIVVGTVYAVAKVAEKLPELVQSFSPAAAAALAEAKRLESATEYLKAAKAAGADSATLTKLTNELPKPPPSDSIPWAALVVAGVLGVWVWSKTRQRTAVMNGLGADAKSVLRYKIRKERRERAEREKRRREFHDMKARKNRRMAESHVRRDS